MRVHCRENPKIRLIEKLNTIMTAVVRVSRECEWGVIVRRNRGKRRVSHRMIMEVASREPVLKYKNSAPPVHLTRPDQDNDRKIKSDRGTQVEAFVYVR